MSAQSSAAETADAVTAITVTVTVKIFLMKTAPAHEFYRGRGSAKRRALCTSCDGHDRMVDTSDTDTSDTSDTPPS